MITCDLNLRTSYKRPDHYLTENQGWPDHLKAQKDKLDLPSSKLLIQGSENVITKEMFSLSNRVELSRSD